MPEGIELPEGHEEHGDNPFLVSVSVTIAILAVLVAAVTLLGHRAHTEELLLQSQATDQWAYYQAKNIRLHEMQSVADLLGALAPQDKEKASALHEKYVKEVERYEGDKDDIGEKNNLAAAQPDKVRQLHDRLTAWRAAVKAPMPTPNKDVRAATPAVKKKRSGRE